MRLAIAAHDPATTSETFIRMQYERLPCALAIHGGPVASETRPGGAIPPLRSLRGMAETAWDVGVRRTRWEGPQTRELARRLARARIDTMLVNFGTHAAALLPASLLPASLTSGDTLLVLGLYAVLAGAYLLVIPLALIWWMNRRWTAMGKIERTAVYGLVFLFFPGLILFAPFINLRMAGQGEARA